MIGRTIENFRIVEKLGEGAMGVVYKAEDLDLQRPVALKFLAPGIGANPEARERLVQEARSAAVLRHEAICTVYGTGVDEGDAFIAMEYCEGETLHALLEREPPSVDEALDLMIRIAGGLAHAHAAGVIHRDLKPMNVMIVPGRGPVLMDFGLARRDDTTQLTAAGTTLGTTSYMSPEQARGTDVDHRTDLWACGVLLYEMLTGRRPFQADYEAAVIYNILNGEPDPVGTLNPEVPFVLEQIVGRCLEKDPAKRYATADELAADLKALRREMEQGPRKERFVGLRRFLARPRSVAAALAVAAVVALGITGLVWLNTEKAIDSVAVLPFANLSGDTTQAFFTEGLTEQLITELQILGARSDLRVIGRTSVMRYRNTEKSLPEIARELNVDAIVEASVIRSGEKILVTAKLIRAHPEKQIWADQFERTTADVLKLNALVAGTIAEQISLGVGDEAQQRYESAETINPRAYEAYLQGRHQFSLTTLASTRRAIERYEECLALEPDFGPAHAYLAEAKVMLAQIQPLPLTEAIPESVREAERALELDENDAAAHAILSTILQMDPYAQLEQADYHSLRALELNPDNSTVLLYRSQYLNYVQKTDEALQLLKRALALDPYDPFLRVNMVLLYSTLGNIEDMQIWFDKTLEVDPGNTLVYWFQGLGLLGAGKADEAAEALTVATRSFFTVEEGSPEPLPMLLAALKDLGRTGEIQAWRRDVVAAAELRYIPPIYLACVYAAEDDLDRTEEWLETSLQEEDVRLIWNLPFIRQMISGDGDLPPRFQSLFDRIMAPLSG